MKSNITSLNNQDLIRGASFFTTGGGVPIRDQVKTVSLLGKFRIPLLSLDEFPDDGYLTLAAELGPTDAPPIKKDKVIRKMLELLQQTTGKKIVGVYPPEIGQESVVIETAHRLKLPIADFDPAGFRAVPYLDINIFNLKQMNISYVPMIVSTDYEEIFLIDGDISYLRLEQILREMTSLSKYRCLYLLGAVVSAGLLQKKNIQVRSYSKAMDFGKVTKLNELIEKLSPKLILNGIIINKSEYEVKGFLGEILTLQTEQKKKYTLVVMNEVIFILDNKKGMLASVPERILLIDPKKINGVCGADITIGTELTVAVINPEKEWRDKKVAPIFGKKRFNSLLHHLSI